MQINNILGDHPNTISEDDILTIKTDCLNFFEQSKGAPMVKFLPKEYDDFRKIKLRHKKIDTNFSQSFNDAMGEVKLRERALFVNSTQQLHHEPFYVFPINSFKFLYSKTVQDSKYSHNELHKIIVEYFNNDAQEVFTDALQNIYLNVNLLEAIQLQCEIIIYNIQYYYAIRCSKIQYPELIHFIQQDSI